MKTYKSYYLLTIMMASLGLTACGGGSGDDSGSGNRVTGVVSDSNPSTRTINVASTTFSTAGSNIDGDEIEDADEIRDGMIVSVESDGAGHAEEVDYDAEVEGIVRTINAGSMDVMGQNVDISQNPNFHSEVAGITSIMDISPNAVVEVSGYSDGMGNIVATYIELESIAYDGSEDLELEGIVTGLDLVNGTFMIGDLPIHFDPNNISLTMEDGLNVEVDIMVIGDTLETYEYHATEIEIEDDYGDEHGEGHEIEIEGMITSGLSDGMFAINGETVILSDNAEYEGVTPADIVDGAMLEVEGYLNNDGVLVVHEVEIPGIDEVDDSTDDSIDN